MPTITLEASQDMKSLFDGLTVDEMREMFERTMAANGFSSMTIARETEEENGAERPYFVIHFHKETL